MTLRRSVQLPAVIMAVVLAAVAGPVAVLAASPGPSPVPSPQASPEPGQASAGAAWLDAPLPLDAAPGSTVTVGALLTSPDGRDVAQFVTPIFHLLPAHGAAAATIANGTPDWRGHFVARLVVPTGGVGRLTIGLRATICENDVCTPQEWPFDPIFVGPPVGVPLPQVSTARLVLPDGPWTAGQPGTVEVEISPNIAWPEPLALPASMLLEVRSGGQVLRYESLPAAAAATGAGGAAGGHATFTGSITFDQPGDYVVQVTTTETPGRADSYGTALRRVTVVAGATEPPSTGAAAGGLPDWWPGALAAVGLLLAGVLILRGRSAEAPRR